MTLERYRDAKRHIRYRLDGKLITAKQANEERANNPSLEFIDKVEPTVQSLTDYIIERRRLAKGQSLCMVGTSDNPIR